MSSHKCCATALCVVSLHGIKCIHVFLGPFSLTLSVFPHLSVRINTLKSQRVVRTYTHCELPTNHVDTHTHTASLTYSLLPSVNDNRNNLWLKCHEEKLLLAYP